MKEPEILISDQLEKALELVIDTRSEAVMSFFSGGRWHIANIVFTTQTSKTLHVDIAVDKGCHALNIQINQPVGISIQYDFNRYIFEASVIGFEASVNRACGGRIILERPDKIERVQRRAYCRVDVPRLMNIKVLFWHRGYTDDSTAVPLENYWQGRLVNISAGGAQIGVDIEQSINFRVGQLVGMQFTPMSYEKPIMLEAHIRHLAQSADDNMVYLGAEFLGLEAGGQGRQKLHRLLEVIEEYEQQNTTESADKTVAAPEEA